jgi:hypothetical protein
MQESLPELSLDSRELQVLTIVGGSCMKGAEQWGIWGTLQAHKSQTPIYGYFY